MNYQDLLMTFSSNLKKLRKEQKITQAELIAELGEENISLRTYKTYESGNISQIPSLEKVVLLAEYFHVSLDYLLLNRSSTYDDSFTKKDSLKRLGRLIFSLTLKPMKETDPESEHFGKYYFVSYDKDVALFLDKYETKSQEKNQLFEYKNIYKYNGIHDFDDVIKEIENLTENWYPTLERFEANLIEANIDPKQYFDNHMLRINKRRNVYKTTKKAR